MGTIEKRGKNSWRVGVRLSSDQGRQWVRRSLTFPASMPQAKQRKAAELELARLTLEVSEGVIAPAAETTVSQLAEIWYTDHVDINLKPTTANTYHALMDKRILPIIGNIPADKLSPLDITRMLNTIRVSGKKTTAIPPDQRKRKADQLRPERTPQMLSDSTMRHIYDTLNDMLDQCVRWQLIPSNPIKKVKRPVARRKRLQFLDDDQAVDLLRKLAAHDNMSFRCAVLLALLCGLRLGEVGALNMSDVDFAHCTINITKAIHYTPKTGQYIDTPKTQAGDRTVSLPAGMMTLLSETKKYFEEIKAAIGDRWKGDGRIVCSWDGSHVHHDTPSKWFRAFADDNGFPGVRFQDLRHSHASILLADKIDAVSVSARLGHESPDTTYRYYAHAIRSRDLASARSMQHLIDRAEGLRSQSSSESSQSNDYDFEYFPTDP